MELRFRHICLTGLISGGILVGGLRWVQVSMEKYLGERSEYIENEEYILYKEPITPINNTLDNTSNNNLGDNYWRFTIISNPIFLNRKYQHKEPNQRPKSEFDKRGLSLMLNESN